MKAVKIPQGHTVYVYFNLHRKMWSLRSCKTRRVIGHSDSVFLKDVVFKVSQSGRNRVLREKQKNIHAGVQGTFMAMDLPKEMITRSNHTRQVRYNPFKNK